MRCNVYADWSSLRSATVKQGRRWRLLKAKQTNEGGLYGALAVREAKGSADTGGRTCGFKPQQTPVLRFEDKMAIGTISYMYVHDTQQPEDNTPL